MTVLTKSAILEGINKLEKVYIESLDTEFWLRPLTSAELDDLEAIEAKGMGTVEQNTNALRNQNIKLNVLNVTVSSAKAKYEKIYKSLDNSKNQEDPWTIDDIKMLPKNAVDELLEKVNEISGVNLTMEDVKNFPED